MNIKTCVCFVFIFIFLFWNQGRSSRIITRKISSFEKKIQKNRNTVNKSLVFAVDEYPRNQVNMEICFKNDTFFTCVSSWWAQCDSIIILSPGFEWMRHRILTGVSVANLRQKQTEAKARQCTSILRSASTVARRKNWGKKQRHYRRPNLRQKQNEPD